MLSRDEKLNIINNFKTNDSDTGSAEVQIALLTENILQLTDHVKINIHDFSAKRGLIAMVSKRKKLLNYLARKDEAKYADVIKKLGLRK